MKQWEYKTMITSPNLEFIIGILNDLGSQGWELISVSDQTMYFKRPIS